MDIQLAIPWLPMAIAAQAIPAIAGLFRKRPRAPQIPDFIGMSDEQRQGLIGAITRQTGRREGAVLRTTREEAAARGGYRSGQLPKIEGEIRSAASEDISNAITDIDLSELDARRQYQAMLAQLREGRYQSELGGYYGDQESAGKGLGQSALLALWAKLYK